MPEEGTGGGWLGLLDGEKRKNGGRNGVLGDATKVSRLAELSRLLVPAKWGVERRTVSQPRMEGSQKSLRKVRIVCDEGLKHLADQR